jgi:hypothetical protein
MKTSFFSALLFTLISTQLQAVESIHFNMFGCEPSCMEHPTADNRNLDELKIVISQKRIWFVADEMPMKCLKAVVKKAEGEIVMEKCFSSKTADWSMNIEALPKGDYTLHLGNTRVEQFKR